MAIKDWNGFKKSGDTYIPNDATARAGVSATVDLLKDTVGWVNKNKLPLTIDGIKAVNTSGTWSGNTYTIGNGTFELQSIDGKNVSKIVANKLASTSDNPALNLPTFTLPKGNYVLNGVPSGGSGSKYYCQIYASVDYPSGAGITDFGDGKEFTLTTTNTIQRGIISIRPNNVFTNLEFELMICDADLIDKSFEPYHESVKDSMFLRSEQVVLGAKNKLEVTLATTTKNGVTATVNNGVISTSGTSNAEWIEFEFNHTALLEAGKYILSGITGGSANTYRFSVSGSVVEDFTLYDGEQEFTITSDGTVSVKLYVRQANVDMSGKVFYPMIRLATDPDDTYVPYAMTNRELTEHLKSKEVTVTAGTDVTVNANTHVYSKAGVVTGSLRLEIGATLSAGATIATLSAIPKNTTYAIGIDNTEKSVIPIIIGNNGAVQLFGGFIPTSGNQLLIPIAYATA